MAPAPASGAVSVTELRYRSADRILDVTFDDGSRFALPAEYLRVESPSAEVQGHGPGQKKLIHGRRHIGIMKIEPVGNYAVRIFFDDLHDTGLYTWATLHQLGREQAERWAEYERALAEKGLSR